MSDYLSKPRAYDSPAVIEQTRLQILQRAWNIRGGHDLATHQQAAREDLTAYLADLDQRNLISGTIHNYFRVVLDVELEKVVEAGNADDAEAIRTMERPDFVLANAVGLDLDESCVELVQRYHDLDRRVNDAVFSPHSYDKAGLLALETERANVVNLIIFHLGNAFRACGYQHDAVASKNPDQP